MAEGKVIQMQVRPIKGVGCQREFGDWTVRVNGHFIVSFNYWSKAKSEAKAREVAMRLEKALAE